MHRQLDPVALSFKIAVHRFDASPAPVASATIQRTKNAVSSTSGAMVDVSCSFASQRMKRRTGVSACVPSPESA